MEGFRAAFDEACRAAVGGTPPVPSQTVDAWIGLGEADGRLLEAIERLAPLGVGNPTPVWGARNVRIVGQPRRVGRGHLKLAVAAGGSQMQAIAFGMADRPLPDGPMDLLFALESNTYMGRTSLQLNVRDFRPSE